MRPRGGPADAPRQIAVEECEDSRKAKFTTSYGEPQYQPPPSFRGRFASVRVGLPERCARLTDCVAWLLSRKRWDADPLRARRRAQRHTSG